MKKCPEPGLHCDIPFSEYCQWEAMNASTLCGAILACGTVSLKYLKAHLDGRIPRKNTKAMSDGRAIHSRLLEPDEFAKFYRVAGPCVNIIKSASSTRLGEVCGKPGIAKGDVGWQCGQHTKVKADDLPDNVISRVLGRKLDRMVEEIALHPVVNLFRHSGGVEVSLVWDQDVTFEVDGKERTTTIRMKGRLDKLILDSDSIPDAIVDLKKTARTKHTEHWFGKQIKDLNYDIKAACYLTGLKALTQKTVNFLWAAVEDDEPYDCNVILADNETRQIGLHKFELLLSEYAKSMHTDVWAGVSDDVVEGGLNSWAKREFRKACNA